MMASNPTLKERLDQSKPQDIWPDPIPLRDELSPVMPFNPDLLPSQLRGWVQDISERMNCPLDLVAIPAMVAAGALIGRRIGIRPQRRTDWLEVANLWGCVVARPGSMKSPAASEALAPIRRLEAKAAEENQTALVSFKASEALHKLEREAAEKGARAALKDKGNGGGRDSAMNTLMAVAEPQTPAALRHLTSDATAEKLGEICAANPHGVMVHRDELLSLFAELDNPEKSSARGFFLTGWGGQDGYTFDRITRGTVHIPAVNLSVFGTTQPSRLAGYVRESIRRFDDGMVQRLQMLSWPDFSGEFKEVDRYPDSAARQQAHECFADLAKLEVRELGAQWDEFDGPHAIPYLRFADDAQEAFSDWRRNLECNKLGSDDLPPALVAHLSKYRGLIPRLALICHLANNDYGPVSAVAAGQAFRWSDYLESHARRAYALSLDDAEAARAIWRKVSKGDLAGPFTARDVQRKRWSGLGDKERVAAGIAALLEADWIGATDVETGGRPSTVYFPNPKALNA